METESKGSTESAESTGSKGSMESAESTGSAGTVERTIAEWMVGEIKFRGMLRQEEAIAHVREHFGEQYVFVNENGNASLSKEVKKAFRKLHGGRVAWDRDGFFWGWT